MLFAVRLPVELSNCLLSGTSVPQAPTLQLAMMEFVRRPLLPDKTWSA